MNKLKAGMHFHESSFHPIEGLERTISAHKRFFPKPLQWSGFRTIHFSAHRVHQACQKSSCSHIVWYNFETHLYCSKWLKWVLIQGLNLLFCMTNEFRNYRRYTVSQWTKFLACLCSRWVQNNEWSWSLKWARKRPFSGWNCILPSIWRIGMSWTPLSHSKHAVTIALLFFFYMLPNIF